jgi:hypothetical protein
MRVGRHETEMEGQTLFIHQIAEEEIVEVSHVLVEGCALGIDRRGRAIVKDQGSQSLADVVEHVAVVVKVVHLARAYLDRQTQLLALEDDADNAGSYIVAPVKRPVQVLSADLGLFSPLLAPEMKPQRAIGLPFDPHIIGGLLAELKLCQARWWVRTEHERGVPARLTCISDRPLTDSLVPLFTREKRDILALWWRDLHCQIIRFERESDHRVIFHSHCSCPLS